MTDFYIQEAVASLKYAESVRESRYEYLESLNKQDSKINISRLKQVCDDSIYQAKIEYEQTMRQLTLEKFGERKGTIDDILWYPEPKKTDDMIHYLKVLSELEDDSCEESKQITMLSKDAFDAICKA